MIRGQPLTAIIPVRGGSKGLPGKNLRRLGRDTLLERAIKFAKTSPRIDHTIVSTDDRQMHDIAKAHGVAAPTLRPAHLATDAATTAAVVENLLAEGTVGDGYILILQATSPLRALSDLERLCAAFEAADAEAAASVAVHEEPRPEKLKRIVDGRLTPYLTSGFEGPRQALPQPYRLNGAFYLISTEAFRRGQAFLPAGTLPFVMPEERSANIDSANDWDVLEAMLAAGRWALEDY